MNNETFDIEKIEMLLRDIPERDLPFGLHERIIDSLPTGNKPRGIPSKLRTCWNKMLLLAPMPMRAGAVLAMTVAAFWLGTEVGAEREIQNNAFVQQIPGNTPAIDDDENANRLSGMGLFEDENNYPPRYFFYKTSLQEERSTGMNRWSDTVFRHIENQPEDEQNSYGTANPETDSVLFLLNLAHNLADSGNYRGALHQYEKVLRLNPQEQTALYNRATSYHHLNDKAGELQAFISYLNQFRSGKWAHQAVGHLQRLGVFDYQASMIGGRKIVINQTVLLGPEQLARQHELERLATYLRQPSAGELHLVVFYKNDLDKSRIIAAELKQQIDSILGKNRELPIRTSWFDEPAPIQTAGGEKHELEKGLFLFTQPSAQQRSNI
ncbi:MAG: tetratricopeptide repeat protein [Desulfoprunum sp.]|jgi:tetratricopeptide (TPR) repeat protein|uniref:tetratricopeptide repeat protein n=1 Tax=Desulfoprunum sp. TaxID=2020866 RepID=UPI00052D0177|nr:hypothetical protein JT06_17955 [Desulfobulbus sp. Tol-SR]